MTDKNKDQDEDENKSNSDVPPDQNQKPVENQDSTKKPFDASQPDFSGQFDDNDDCVEDYESDDDRFDAELSLPEGAMCENHPDEPAVGMYGGEPLCEECGENYIDGFRSNE